MMGDLIDRDALLAECAEAQKSDPNFDGRGWANHFINAAGEPSAEWDAVEAMIEYAPAVDAAPVVHGRWTERHVDEIEETTIDAWQSARCSVCGLYHTTPYLYSFTDYKFCPHCGARMDGGDDDANGT